MKGEVTISELRKKSDAELLGRKNELEREIYVARSSVVTGGDAKKSAVAPMRKEKARILTLLRERELKQEPREPLL